MKKLNGKCLDAFLIFVVKHFRENRPDYAKYSDYIIVSKFARRHELDQQQVVVEFFDSVGIYINALSFEKGGYWKAICSNDMLKKKYVSRTEAYNGAIIKANQIFNEL